MVRYPAVLLSGVYFVRLVYFACSDVKLHLLCNRTFKRGCLAHISLRANDKGSALQVKSVCFDHNHEISQVKTMHYCSANSVDSRDVCLQELFRHLPQQRQLSAATKEKVASLLQMDANKKLVQQQISQESGKIVLLKDLANTANSKKGKSKNDLDTSISQLIDKYGR